MPLQNKRCNQLAIARSKNKLKQNEFESKLESRDDSDSGIEDDEIDVVKSFNWEKVQEYLKSRNSIGKSI